MSRHYFDQMSDTWDEAASERNLAKLSLMAKRLNIAPSTTVLDVGTGTGILIPFLLRKTGDNGRIVAVDFAEKMLRKARDKGFRGNIDYLCADVAHLPLGNEIFEVAVCYASFPHFHNKPVALKELSRVIKRGGRLFICHTSS